MGGEVSRRDILSGGLGLGAGVLGFPESSLANWTVFEAPRKRGEKESIFDTKIGSFLPPRPMDLLKHRKETLGRVVVVGEAHTNPLHHRAELEVIQALHKLEPERPLVIGLEHFYRKHQGYLDGFIAGDISMSKLHELTQWERTFGYEFMMWTPIFKYCREMNVRLLGLNLPHQVVHLVSQMGLENVPKNLRELLPEMDLDNEVHKARFRKNMGLDGRTQGVGNHGFDSNSVLYKRYYEAATLWDEYMAESASMWLNNNDVGRLVVLAGASHVAGRVGIPDRITRRTGCDCFTIVPEGVQWVDHQPVMQQVPKMDTADWVWYTEREVDLV